MQRLRHVRAHLASATSAAAAAEEPRKPLEGIRVVELASVMAAPVAVRARSPSSFL
jgi:hypothetical protein